MLTKTQAFFLNLLNLYFALSILATFFSIPFSILLLYKSKNKTLPLITLVFSLALFCQLLHFLTYEQFYYHFKIGSMTLFYWAQYIYGALSYALIACFIVISLADWIKSKTT